MASFVVILALLFTITTGYEEMDCFKACTREYNPVCGVNYWNEYEIFSNPCVLNYAICRTRSRRFFAVRMW